MSMQTNPNLAHSENAPFFIVPYLKLIRPKQWTKNLFVFGGLFFSHNLMHADKVQLAIWTFLAFCLISSAVYVLNDIVDVEKDRMHPKKKNRPLAAGQIRIPMAVFYGLLLFVSAVSIASILGLKVLGIVLVYFMMNVLYSFMLKNIVLVDVFVIALGFVFRVLAGTFALPVEPSPWLLLCTFLLSLFLGLAKRRAEILVLQSGAGSHRKILEEYNADKLIDQLISVVSSATIMAYALYTFNSPEGQRMMYTIPFVIYAMFRYLYLVYKKEGGGEPANILIGDKPFLISCVLFAIVALAIIYVL